MSLCWVLDENIRAKQYVFMQMAKSLGAAAVLQRYSRLVIDCNRPHDAVDAMPLISDGISIAANVALSDTARAARVSEIYGPYQAAIEALFQRTPRRVLLSIHSFTPTMDGLSRPWEIGFLFRQDTVTSQGLGQFVQDRLPGLTVGFNQPYQIDDESDWFVPQHGEAKGVSHSLIEIRNDQIDTAQGQVLWAETLVNAVERYLKEN